MEKGSFEDDSSRQSSSYGLLSDEGTLRRKRVSRLSCWKQVIFACHGLLLLLNIALTTGVLRQVSKQQPETFNKLNIPSHGFTDGALEWELRPFDDVFHHHESIYRGLARPELDQAWQKLLRGFDMRVPYPGWTTPSSVNASVVRLLDGTNDGFAVPTVLHNIHCLRTIREYFLPEHYPITAARYPHPPGEINTHVDHCLDTLRQSVMCSADMTLMTYEWWDRTPYPQVVSGDLHKCANWQRLTTWVQERGFDRHGPILRHPKTGIIPNPLDGTDPVPAHNAYWEAHGQPENKFGHHH